MGEITPISHSNGDSHGLTPIHPRIHCAATPDTPEEHSELDAIAIDNFIEELASITISIIRRSARPAEDVK